MNGYSGHYPPSYAETIVKTQAFPDDGSIAYLTDLGVRYVIVHWSHYTGDEFVSMVGQMMRRPELDHFGTFLAPSGEVELFVLANRP